MPEINKFSIFYGLRHGWGAGSLLLLLQLLASRLPLGEIRDWNFYIGTGALTAFYILSACAGRLRLNAKIRMAGQVLATLLSLYGVAALSYYLLPLMWSQARAGIWLLAAMMAYAWQKQLGVPGGRYARWLTWAGMSWFFLCVFALLRSLYYRILQWDELPHDWRGTLAALPFIAGLAFVLHQLWKGDGAAGPVVRRGLRIPMLLAALAVLAVPALAVAVPLANPIVAHHWKAFLEAAASVRSGGWLLWDVPSQYGFLQTLVIAFLPAPNAWQSFYLLNAGLLVLSGYMVLTALWARYPSMAGFIFALGVALMVTAMTYPMANGYYFPLWTEVKSGQTFSFRTTGSPLVLPSGGPMRFIWIYLICGYVFHLSNAYAQSGSYIFSRIRFLLGHVIWAAGALWSFESAVFVTLLWVPALAMVAVAEACAAQATPSLRVVVKHVAMRYAQLAAFVAVLAGGMAALYLISIGHLPDVALLTAYADVYVAGFNVFPINPPAATICWLLLFCAMAALCHASLRHLAADAQSWLDSAVLYVAVAGLWLACSYYIPLSDDVHLACTLPLMVYLSALLLRILPRLAIAHIITSAYEKIVLCLCGMVLWGGVSYFDMGVYARSPLVYRDVTQLLLPPPPPLQELLDKAKLPPHAPVLLLTGLFEAEERLYINGMEPWVLPNTLVGYDVPLPKERYTELALRRAARMDAPYGWVIEASSPPLDHYSWLQSAIAHDYKQVQVWENSRYRIRKFARIR